MATIFLEILKIFEGGRMQEFVALPLPMIHEPKMRIQVSKIVGFGPLPPSPDLPPRGMYDSQILAFTGYLRTHRPTGTLDSLKYNDRELFLVYLINYHKLGIL